MQVSNHNKVNLEVKIENGQIGQAPIGNSINLNLEDEGIEKVPEPTQEEIHNEPLDMKIDTLEDPISEEEEESGSYDEDISTKNGESEVSSRSGLLGKRGFREAIIDTNIPKNLDIPQQGDESLNKLIYKPEIDYKREYCKIYLANMTLMGKIDEMEARLKTIKTRIDMIKVKESSLFVSKNGNTSTKTLSSYTSKNGTPIMRVKKKRKRMKKADVVRNFKCMIGECSKGYGSENSLNQHIKNKHPLEWAEVQKLRNREKE